MNIIRQYSCIYIQTNANVAVSCTKGKRCVTMTININLIHCMIYYILRPKRALCLTYQGTAGFARLVHFYIINVGKIEIRHIYMSENEKTC